MADDDDDIRDLVAYKLASLGHDVVSVADGEAALAAVRSESFDLVILDVMMPVLTGLETLAGIRADPLLAHVPVILLTALASARDQAAGLAAGADDYLTKPFNLRELSQRVEALLPHHFASA